MEQKKHEVETDLPTVNHRTKTSALNLYFF